MQKMCNFLRLVLLEKSFHLFLSIKAAQRCGSTLSGFLHKKLLFRGGKRVTRRLND